MTFDQLKIYFEDYASIHVDIQHSDDKKAFIAVHSDKEADEFIKTCKSEFIFVLITPDKKLFPVKGENYNWDKYICFFILKNCGRSNESAITAAQGRCEIIGNDFCTRLIADRTTKIRGFVQESFAMQPVGPMSDDMYGQACMFNLVDEFEYQVDPNRWL